MQVYHGGLITLTFSSLSDKETGLYQKPWKEIYKALLDELSLEKKPE